MTAENMKPLKSGRATRKASPRRAARLTSAALLPLLLWLAAHSASAQNIQYTGRLADQTKRSSFRVDPATLGLNIEIPLNGYPGRAGMSLPITLNYSSKLWRMKYVQAGDQQGGNTYVTWVAPSWSERSASGWTSSLAVPTFVGSDTELYDGSGHPSTNCAPNCWYVRRLQVQMPDGSSHELRHTSPNVSLSSNQTMSGTYFATDGSGLKYEYDSRTLYLPDGSRYGMGSIGSPTAPTTFTDRNGNRLTYDADANHWSDTLGRTINAPPIPMVVPGFPGAGLNPGEYPYKLKKVGGADMTYTFKWKALADALTDPNQELAFPGDCSGILISNPPVGPYLFQSINADMVCEESPSSRFNPTVLAEIVLPDNTSYKFTYNVYGEIDKVVYPTGGYERFVYDTVQPVDWVTGAYMLANRGVTHHYVSPSGSGADEAHWQYSAGYIDGNFNQPYKVTITAPPPDGTVTERLLHTAVLDPQLWGYGDVRAGRPYEERVLTPTGQMLRRTLTQWVASPQGSYANKRDPRMTKQVEIRLDTSGANALTKTTAYGYDGDLNVTSTAESAYLLMNKATAQTAAIGSISAGTVLRTSETTFLVNDININSVTRGDYRAQNLIRLPSSTRVRDTAGDVVAQSEIKYDEPNVANFPIAPYGAVTGWVDPQTSVRGNPTTTRNWIKTSDTWVEAHARYDQCGSLRLSWDANDPDLLNPTKTDYSATYHFAYPTTMTTAVPDPGNTGRGGTSGLVSQTTYDPDTGIVTSITDANTRITTLKYEDALGRLTEEDLPDGGSRSYTYDRMAQTGGTWHYVRTRTSIDATRSVDSYQFFDGLGRPSRAYAYDGSAADRQWVATKTTYDSQGRAEKTSNPTFTATLEDFTPAANTLTTNEYDLLGRVKKITTPDGAYVTTSYDLDEVTVTDQAGKKRSSVSDALGRLEKVVEAPGVTDYGYETTYEYDALGNLTKVVQGKVGQARQTRQFSYDSLSRLTSATNPESGTTLYEYYDAGNLKKRIDARHVQTDYTYDALNRVTKRAYSIEPGYQAPAGYVATPEVNYFYDGTGMPSENATPLPTPDNSAGRLTAVKSAASDTVYTQFDGAGRVKKHRQIIDPGTASEQTYLMEYGYDLAGNLTTEKYPSGKVFETDYDGAGRVAGVKQQATGFYYAGGASGGQMQYAAHGAVEALKLGNGLWEHTTFNSRLQPEQIGLGDSAADWGELHLTYGYGPTGENNGNVRSQRIEGGGLDVTQTYTYDFVNRLESAREAPTAGGADTWRQTYTYLDAAGQNGQFGNRRIKTGTDPIGQPLTTPNATPQSNPEVEPLTNRFADNQGYAYDAAGNLRQDSSHSYGYDAENKLVSVDGGWDGAAGASYSYDGDGRRVRKASASETTAFVYDATGRVVAEYSNQVQYAGTKYLTQDQLGSTRVVTDAQGNAHSNNGASGSRHDYLPFGERLDAGSSGRTPAQGYVTVDNVRQQFTGAARDAETSMDFMQARYYAASAGRFTSPDDFFNDSNPSDPQSWNKYAYARNNPLKYIDPTGEKADISIDTNEEAKTGVISIKASIGIYAQGISQEQLSKARDQIEQSIKGSWGGPFKGKDGITYTIKLEVTVQAFGSKESAMKAAAGDSGIQNVIAISRDQASSGEVSFVQTRSDTGDKSGPDVGVWHYASIMNRNQAAHEFTHVLGATNMNDRSGVTFSPNPVFGDTKPVESYGKAVWGDYNYVFGEMLHAHREASRPLNPPPIGLMNRAPYYRGWGAPRSHSSTRTAVCCN